jgi:hypothetical protein
MKNLLFLNVIDVKVMDSWDMTSYSMKMEAAASPETAISYLPDHTV